MKRLAIFVIVLGVGCAEEKADTSEDKPDEPEKTPTDKTEPPADKVPSDQPPADKKPAAGGFCDAPCRALATEKLSAVSKRAQSECRVDISDGEDCNELDFLRNCIYADGGYKFRKKKWQGRFAKESWYKPDPKFKESSISKVGMANVKELKELAAQCRGAKRGTIAGTIHATATADLNGDGKKEKVEVGDREIAVAGYVIKHDLDPYDAKSVKAEVVDIDKKDKAKEVLLKLNEYEDIHQYIFVSMGKAGPVATKSFYTGSFTLDGKGSARTEDTNCGQTHKEVYKRVKGVVRRTSRKTTGKYNDADCAACPFVYVFTSGRWHFRGEILRDHNSASLRGSQRLRLGVAESGVVRIQIAEHKREVTHLDDVAVVADGVLIKPRQCAGGLSSVCERDQLDQVLEQGDAIELVFDVPIGAELELEASGYYEPL